jgi:hypothetical protein
MTKGCRVVAAAGGCSAAARGGDVAGLRWRWGKLKMASGLRGDEGKVLLREEAATVVRGRTC